MVSKQSTSICGSYACHGKKACSAYTIKEDFLKEKILCDIRSLLQEIDKEQYLKELEVKSKKAKKDLQQKLDRINKQIDLLKVRKQNFIKMMADEKITHDEYLEMVEDNNTELNQLLEKKNEMLSLLEKEKVIDNIDNLKKELLQFLKFDELTPETLHGLINRIDVKADGVPIIHYRFNPQNLNRSRLFPYREPASSFKTICDTTSTCDVCGNISTGCISSTLYFELKTAISFANVDGLHDTYAIFFGFTFKIVFKAADQAQFLVIQQ